MYVKEIKYIFENPNYIKRNNLNNTIWSGINKSEKAMTTKEKLKV